MSLVNRKPRPLIRDSASLRDDRLFIVACDDTYAPKQYFDAFQITRVKIHVVPTEDGTAAQHVLRRLLEFDHEYDDELWMLLDTDHFTSGSHLPKFHDTLREAKQKGVNVALSKPCFELWLLLHHVEETGTASLAKCSDVNKTLKDVLGEYNKTKLPAGHFPLSSVPAACSRAKRLDQQVPGGEIPSTSTTRVYFLWEAIVKKALPSQLPAELRSLIPTH
jgi:hypothetical protein